MNLEKLEHKLKFAVDLGIDFLLRNTNDEGVIANEQDIYKHCLATWCLTENPRNQENKVELALGRISSQSYVDGKYFFIGDLNKPNFATHAIAALSFLSFGKKDWAFKYANTVVDKGIKNEQIQGNEEPQVLFLLIRLFEETHSKSWIELIKEIFDNMINRQVGFDYWSALSVYEANKHIKISRLNEIETLLSPRLEVELDLLAVCGDNFHSVPLDNVEQLCYDRLGTQRSPSSPWKGGAFLDENENARIDLSQKNIDVFNRILRKLEMLK